MGFIVMVNVVSVEYIMKHKVQCAICGKKGIVEIDDWNKMIYDDWGYFGKVMVRNKDGIFKRKDGTYNIIEYWECPNCLKEVLEVDDRR
jgi:hypothetical protein